MPDEQATGTTISERVFGRLPDVIANSLTTDQRAAITGALAAEAVDKPPVNIRVSVPHLLGRWYLTIFAGKERRSHKRLKSDRIAYPLRTAGNLFFITTGIGLFYALSAIGYLIYSSVLEF